MERQAQLEEIRNALQEFLEKADPEEDRRSMEALVDGFFKEVVYKCTDRELTARFAHPADAVRAFSDYLIGRKSVSG